MGGSHWPTAWGSLLWYLSCGADGTGGLMGFHTPPPAVVCSVVFSVVLGECLWCLWGFLLADFSWVTRGDLRLPWSPTKIWEMDPLIFRMLFLKF